MEIAVIGAHGFVGSTLARLLEKQGNRVTKLSMRPGNSAQSLIDLRTKLPKLDALVHCSGVINGSHEELESANVRAVSQVLEIAREKPDIRWIHISSVSAIHSLGPYGDSKRRGERLLEASSLGNWVVLRPSMIYGPGDRKNLNMLAKVLRNLPLAPIPYHPRVTVQPLFVGDLYKIVEVLLQSKTWSKKYWTVGGPAAVSVFDLAKTIKNDLNSSALIIPIPLFLIKKAAQILSVFGGSRRLPLQQFAFMHEHPPWDSSEVQRDLGVMLTGLREGLSLTLRDQGLF